MRDDEDAGLLDARGLWVPLDQPVDQLQQLKTVFWVEPTGNLWSHYPAPYLYVGGPRTSQGGGGGMAIWNVLNPGAPTLVRFMDMPALVGFTCASVNVVGNLMTISGIYDVGHVLLDLSDPVNPVIVDRIERTGGETPYIALVNGGRLYAGNTGRSLVSIYDLSNPFEITYVRDIGRAGGGEVRVPWIQDNFAHFCSKGLNSYQKVDLTTGAIVGEGRMPGHSSEVAVPCGNWAFVGQNKDDVGAEGGHIVPYQTLPDNRGPEVNMVNPTNGAIRRALTSRVGITLTDQIDTRTVNSSTFIIRPVGGAALSGRYSNQMGILNFFPNSNLLANTTYEIIVPAGGIKDVAGNAVTVPFRSLFSTGSTVGGGTTVTPPVITSQPISRTVIAGQTATFSVVASGTAPLTYQWQKRGVNISGATGASYTTPATTIADSGAAFRVLISNSVGSVTSAGATLTVTGATNQPPQVSIARPASGTTFAAGASLYVLANASDANGSIANVKLYLNDQLVRQENSFPYEWGAAGQNDTRLQNMRAGTYAVRAVATDNAGAMTTSSVITVTVTQAPSAGTIPAPWLQQDIGSVGAAGSASYANGIFTVRGSGADIWYGADAFRFVYRPLTGNGQIIARVSSVQNTDPWAKAGVMIRETLSPQSKHAMLVVTPANGVSFQWRATTGGGSSYVPGSSNAAPYWVRLVRSGNTFTGYKSVDGSAWVQVGSATIAMASTVSIGLPVTAHNNAALCTATFDNVNVTATASVAAIPVGTG
jgi:regulation of enolase protein 1 (concanavalin A-like superfamily)